MDELKFFKIASHQNNALEMLWFAVDSFVMAVRPDTQQQDSNWRRQMNQIHKELEEAKSALQALMDK